MKDPRSEWTSHDISMALRVKGYTLRRLADELNITPNTLLRNIRSGRNVRIRAEISKILHVPEWHLWPEAFPPQWREEGPPAS